MELKSETEQLEDAGFTVIRGLYAPEDIAEIRELLVPLLEEFDSLKGRKARDIGDTFTSEQSDGALKQPEIDRPTRFLPLLFKTSIFQKTRKAASSLLGSDARYAFDHVICKMPGSETETPWHQDQAYLGPNVWLNTVNFWIPLQDVDEENGTLSYLPGSHHDGLHDHAIANPEKPHVRTTEGDKEAAIPVRLKVGDCSVHNSLSVHRASRNKSAEPRYAWILHFNRYGRLAYFAPRNIPGLIARVL
jgi:phytanoyl-CoA dioxygenase PhyH